MNRLAAVFVSCLVLASSAVAQDNEATGHATLEQQRAVARQIGPNTPRAEIVRRLLIEEGVSDIDGEAKALARKEMESENQTYYDRWRVEVTGVGSRDNDSQNVFQGMFDATVHPSQHLDSLLRPKPSGPLSWIRGEAQSVKDYVNDLRHAKDDRAGQMTDAAREAVAPLRGKQIYELVCHSWGTEVTYDAILNGVIKPPRRIVVVAPPNDNIEKWRMLAKWTGADVIYLRGGHDKVVEAATLTEARAAEVPNDKTLLEELWFQHCKDRDCRVADPYDFNAEGKFSDLSGALDQKWYAVNHDRLDYYEQLRRLEPHFKKTAFELGRPQKDRVDQARKQLLEAVNQDVGGVREFMPDPEQERELESIRHGSSELRDRMDLERRERQQAKITAPVCGRTCRDFADLAMDNCKHPNHQHQSYVEHILAQDDGVPFANVTPFSQDGPFERCATQILRRIYSAKQSGERLDAFTISGWAYDLAPRNYRFEYNLVALAKYACDHPGSVTDYQVGNLEDPESEPILTPPDPPESECAALVYEEARRYGRGGQTKYLYNIAAKNWHSLNDPRPIGTSPDRKRGGAGSSGGSNVPNRTWKPTFPPN